MLDDLRARGVKFHSLTEAIDTATPTGRTMWRMIGVLADYAARAIMQSRMLGAAPACAPTRF
jgi:DNA invertase Pin-like site-specific DNA recombinase